jgi:membrane dipeptidase
MTPSQLQTLAAERPVFDAHADSLQRALDMGHDLGVRGSGHLDVERGREGGLGALVFVSWVDPKFIAQGPRAANQRTRDLLREFHRLARRHPERVVFAGNAQQLDHARARGALAGIPGIEGGHSIENDIDELEWFFAHGVRVMTLVWNNHLTWIRSCQAGAGAEIPEGLSDLGRDIVRRMNQLGMLVDLSHAGRKSFFDALEVTDKPVIASHSGCTRVRAHQRNLDDEQLRALAHNGGVVGIVFCTAFLDAQAQSSEDSLRKTDAYKAIGGANDSDQFVAQSEFMQRELAPLSIERVLDHTCHAIEIAGIEHVGIGSDFDGIQRTPQGLESAACYMNLAAGLMRRGLALDDVRKVLGGNMRRVYAAATGPGTSAATATLEPLD